MEILLLRMKYTQEIVGTHGGALLPGRAPGACSGSKIPRVYRPLQPTNEKSNQLNQRSCYSFLLMKVKECSNFQSLLFDIFLFVRVQVLPESMYD